MTNLHRRWRLAFETHLPAFPGQTCSPWFSAVLSVPCSPPPILSPCSFFFHPAGLFSLPLSKAVASDLCFTTLKPRPDKGVSHLILYFIMRLGSEVHPCSPPPQVDMGPLIGSLSSMAGMSQWGCTAVQALFLLPFYKEM